jgi:hypothetical protein
MVGNGTQFLGNLPGEHPERMFPRELMMKRYQTIRELSDENISIL